MFYPLIDEVKLYAKDYNIIPVTMEVYADMETPISLFKRFEDSNYCFLLESVEGGEKWARYSIIGRNPFLIVKSKDNKTTIEHKDGTKKTQDGNPIEIMKKLMKSFRGPDIPRLPRFNGGAVGFFGYDLIRYYEAIPNKNTDDLKLPDCHFMFADEVIVFDHLKQKIHIIVNLRVENNMERAYSSAVGRLRDIYKEILATRWKITDNFKPDFNFDKKPFIYTSNTSKEEYCNNVSRAKEYIAGSY